jgi:hypothetical protein
MRHARTADYLSQVLGQYAGTGLRRRTGCRAYFGHHNCFSCSSLSLQSVAHFRRVLLYSPPNAASLKLHHYPPGARSKQLERVFPFNTTVGPVARVMTSRNPHSVSVQLVTDPVTKTSLTRPSNSDRDLPGIRSRKSNSWAPRKR